MRSSSSRQPVGLFIPSSRRKRAFGRFGRPSSRFRSLLVGATLVAGALVVPAPRAWAQSLVGDANGPKVQIFSPAYQDVLKGKSRILVGIAAGQYNPATVEFWVDDRPATRPLPLTSVASMSFDWDTHRFSDGPHKLSIRVTDTQGFRGVKEINIYINNQNKRDLVAPELKWKNVDAFQQLSGQAQVELETKNSFGVKWIIVKVTPTDKNNASAARSWMLGGGQVKFKFDTTKVADGIYTLSAKAWDALEQEGNAPSLTIGVVNSPINATTVGESLDGLRRMAQLERAKLTGGASDPKNALPALVKGPVVPRPPVASALVNPNKPAKVVVPPATTLTPLEAAPTTGGLGGQLAPLFIPRIGAVATKPTKPGKTKGPRIAKRLSPEVQTPAVLSKRETRVLSPAQTDANAQTTPDKTFMARVGAPDSPTRVEEANASLSAPVAAAPKGVLSPARAALTEAALTEEVAPRATEGRIEIARLSLPEEGSRDLQSAPTLSVGKAFNGVASSSSAATISTTRRVESALVVSAPVESALVEQAPRLPSQHAKVVLSPRETKRYTPKRIETTPVATVPATAAQNVAVETTAELSTPKVNAATEAVSTPKALATSPLAKIGRRIAARPSAPRPSADVENALPGDERAAITISPIQTAFNTAVPKQHLVKTETTLRALADHYGLPVEMVAAANNWNSNMRVIPGMVVLLPRQVELSYNGQKIGGDVSSMLLGDTTVTAMRFLFEKTGGKLEWNAAKQEVIARKGASTIRVKIGSKVASVGNKQVMMQLAAFLFEGRTMVPARFFEEGLDAQVEWNPETGHLVVAMAN